MDAASRVGLRNVRCSVPYQPGLYEWGTKVPGCAEIVAFYLGKAGAWTGRCPELE